MVDYWRLETGVQTSSGKRFSYTAADRLQRVKGEQNWLVKLNIEKRTNTDPSALATTRQKAEEETLILSANQGKQFKIPFVDITRKINQDFAPGLKFKTRTEMHQSKQSF